MTRNQIEYQRNLESKRANLANEEIGRGNLAEAQRANQAREAENYRSNVAREVENNRSNLANERLKAQQNKETNRSNLAAEMLRYAELTEQNRANIAREDENSRHNKASEAETQRHNVESENHATFATVLEHSSGAANRDVQREIQKSREAIAAADRSARIATSLAETIGRGVTGLFGKGKK